MNSPQSQGHVFLIDDDPSMRQSIERMLVDAGYLVSSYESGEEYLEKSIPVSPAVILLDMRMPSMTGIELQQKINELGRKTPIIFISGESAPSEIVSGFKQGAMDFLFKPFNLKDLFKAIIRGIEVDRETLKEMTESLSASQRYSRLTPREREVCHLLVDGLMNKDIAKNLGTTDATIKVHKARVIEKMQADSLQSLVRIVDQALKNPI